MQNKGQRVVEESSNSGMIGKSTARIAILGVSSALVKVLPLLYYSLLSIHEVDNMSYCM